MFKTFTYRGLVIDAMLRRSSGLALYYWARSDGSYLEDMRIGRHDTVKQIKAAIDRVVS